MRSGLTVLAMGERAVLVEAGPLDPAALAEVITRALGDRVEDALPAAATVLVRLVDDVTSDLVDRIAGLSAKGHLGPGADADVTCYRPDRDLARMFALPAKVFKAGVLVAEDGHLRATPAGHTHTATPAERNRQEGSSAESLGGNRF